MIDDDRVPRIVGQFARELEVIDHAIAVADDRKVRGVHLDRETPFLEADGHIDCLCGPDAA
ncbi:MAG: hypothetical protein ACJ74H_10460 [Thermoanaerobaculia bacterium]